MVSEIWFSEGKTTLTVFNSVNRECVLSLEGVEAVREHHVLNFHAGLSSNHLSVEEKLDTLMFPRRLT